MKFNKKIKIGNYIISDNSKAFIIAEAGVNHCADIQKAKKLIEVAAGAGANAVKFQAFKTESLILKGVNKAPYQLKTTRLPVESQFDMLKKLEITIKQIKELKAYCDKLKIIFLITPFDENSLDELDSIDLLAYKIASTDLTNLPYLKKVANKRKPIILSTGMSYFSEVEAALKEIYPINKDIVLLQCTANYPVDDKEVNLNVIKTFMDSFNILVGYSDHSIGIGAAPYAAALGAKVIEKHFTLDKNLDGPDHKASLNPGELSDFIKEIRKVEKFMGSYNKKPTLSEAKTKGLLQKYLVAKRKIKKGDFFTEDNIVAKRTGGVGISPISYKSLLGVSANKDYKNDEIISE